MKSEIRKILLSMYRNPNINLELIAKEHFIPEWIIEEALTSIFSEMKKMVPSEEEIREIMTNGVISNPPLNNEQMISYKAKEIHTLLTERLR